MPKMLIRLFCLFIALGFLSGINYFFANTVARVDPASELARMRFDDEMRIKRHLRICSQAEIISRGIYELTSALSGYALTRGKAFEARYIATAQSLPIRTADLKHICSDIKFELILAQEVDKQTGEILVLTRDAKDILDGPDQFRLKFKDLFAKLRPNADKLDSALMKLRESDFMEVNRALKVPPQAPPQTGTVIVTLAFFNAFYGFVVGALFVLSLRKSKPEEQF